jgi:hypothetical protein
LHTLQRGPMCGHGWARVVFLGLFTSLVGKATLAEVSQNIIGRYFFTKHKKESAQTERE